jgi:hypothetical protein
MAAAMLAVVVHIQRQRAQAQLLQAGQTLHPPCGRIHGVAASVKLVRQGGTYAAGAACDQNTLVHGVRLG